MLFFPYYQPSAILHRRYNLWAYSSNRQLRPALLHRLRRCAIPNRSASVEGRRRSQVIVGRAIQCLLESRQHYKSWKTEASLCSLLQRLSLRRTVLSSKENHLSISVTWQINLSICATWQINHHSTSATWQINIFHLGDNWAATWHLRSLLYSALLSLIVPKYTSQNNVVWTRFLHAGFSYDAIASPSFPCYSRRFPRCFLSHYPILFVKNRLYISPLVDHSLRDCVVFLPFRRKRQLNSLNSSASHRKWGIKSVRHCRLENRALKRRKSVHDLDRAGFINRRFFRRRT